MTEPDVTITDYLLTAESLTLAVLLHLQTGPGTAVQRCFTVFFLMTAVGACVGGTVHGFFLETPGAIGRWLWRIVLLALGVAASAIWMVAAHLLLPPESVTIVRFVVVVEWMVYALVVVLISDAFWIAIANYLPATLCLVVAYAVAYRADPQPSMRMGLIGLGLTLVAAAIQRLKIALHRRYFNHNALYHLVQAIALFLIFVSARFLIGR